MMKHKILFLDLDGTIREPKTGKWVSPWNNQKAIVFAREAVKIYHERGYRMFGITNQGGVGAGHRKHHDEVAPAFKHGGKSWANLFAVNILFKSLFDFECTF